ncbi:MAG: penicillin-binding protein activator [Rhodobacteraceae bacterium]|nr:penicillin-binding protein activator [Paracoccaceae bacterium]
MLKFRLSFSRFLRPVLLGLTALTISACAGGLQGPSSAVDPTKPVIVAMMVPFGSGEAANDQLAQNLVNAANMATRDLQGAVIDLRIYESGTDPVRAATEAERAIAEGAQIIIGPLFSSATSAAAAVARLEGVNVISFSNNAAIAGGNVYIMGVTFEDVATRLYGYVARNGMTNVGVVYPEGVEGEAGLRAASNAARSVGATLTAVTSYPLNMEGLSEAAPLIAETIKANGVQALLFTDTPTRGLPFIAAALGSEDVSRLNTQFLGLTRWDSSTDLLLQPSLQDGLFAVPDPELTAQFNDRYLNTYGTEPHNLAAIAYDAVAVVGALIRSSAAEGATDTFSAERLTNPAGFIGANGVFRFRADGRNERGLAILKVETGLTIEVDAAPRNFGGFGF